LILSALRDGAESRCFLNQKIMDQILEKLFESVPKARVLRLLTQNQTKNFSLEEISKSTQLKTPACRKEIEKFVKLGLVQEKKYFLKEKTKKITTRGRKKKIKEPIRKIQIKVFAINQNFEIFTELKNMISRASFASNDRLLQQIKKLGRVKLAVVAGVFLDQENSRTDILVVGDDITQRKMENFLTQVESDTGRSLQYTLMETDEFKYRLGMYDRFLRDILEYPHKKLINKLEI